MASSSADPPRGADAGAGGRSRETETGTPDPSGERAVGATGRAAAADADIADPALRTRLEEIARERWDLRGVLEPLPGYDELSARLTTAEGARFVLKLARARTARSVLEAQHRALHRLAAGTRRRRFPVPVPSRSGDELVEVDVPGGEGLARLLTWVPGVPLSRVRPHRPGQLEGAGRLLGTVDRILEGVDEPAARRFLEWDLRRGRDLVAGALADAPDSPIWPTPPQSPDAPDAPGMLDTDRATLLEGVLALYDARVAPVEAELRAGLLHGDGNDDNVLVEPVGRDLLATRRVVGLIDFGDLIESWVVAEPAIAAAYLMMGKAEPLGAAERVVAGYHSVHGLTPGEVEALFPLICLRLAVSVTLAARRRAQGRSEPYLFLSEGPAWELLERLREVSPDLAGYGFRTVCGLPPSPATVRVVEWLSANREAVGPVLDPDPRAEPRLTLDLSVGSPELAGLDGSDDPEAWTRVLFGRMEAAGATVGVGLYDEARRWYVGDLYEETTDRGPAWRTVHTGVDLFVAPGTPVRAPLPGTVHSLRDNAGPRDYGPTVVVRHEADGTDFHTLYGHLDRESLEGWCPGDVVERGDVLGRVGTPSDNGGWAPHLHLQIVVDMLGRTGEFPGVCRPDRRALWTSLSPDPNLLLRLPEGCTAAPPPSPEALREDRIRRLGPNLSLAYRKSIHVVRGRGVHLFDMDGQRWLDCVNNVAHVGHGHPRVVDALRRQAAVLNTNTRYLHGSILEYARRLTALLPDPLRICWFVCSGSEANELALRLARTHTGRRDVLVQDGAYHGNTSAAVAMSPYKFDGPGGEGRPPWVRTVPMPDPYRGRHPGREAGAAYAAEVRRACETAAGEGRPLAAFFAEPVLSCGGQIEPPPGYLAAAFDAIREAGGVAVADEVQVGFGRLGTHWWGFQTQDAVPDIVTLGKPMGNGHPLAAVVTTPAVARSFDSGMEYFNTFGGNPVSCAVGLAVLDVIRDEGLRERARAVGGRLKGELTALQDRHSVIGDVRGRGLFLGVELVVDRTDRTPAPDHAHYVVERARELGVLLSTDGPDRNVIKIKPPLVFGDEHADRLVETVDRILHEDPVRP